MNIVEECCQQLNHVMEFSCDKLHNSIREFLFQRIDYCKVGSIMPQWIAYCGINPELSTSKDAYEWFKRYTNHHPIFGLYIYYYDIWCKLQQFKIDCKLFRYFYRNSMILYHIMLNMKNANILQQEELVVSMN